MGKAPSVKEGPNEVSMPIDQLTLKYRDLDRIQKRLWPGRARTSPSRTSLQP